MTAMGEPAPEQALRHPLRARIHAILEQRTASAVELSRILRAELGVVAYHVRVLHRLGMIELVRETQVRGAVQRHFRAIPRARAPLTGWSGRPVAKQSLVDAALEEILELARSSNASGGFDRPDARLTLAKLRLDERGWTRLAERLHAMMREVDEIERLATARLAASAPPPMEQVALVMMQFQGSSEHEIPP